MKHYETPNLMIDQAAFETLTDDDTGVDLSGELDLTTTLEE